MSAYYLLLRIAFNARKYRCADWLTERNRDCTLLKQRLESLRFDNGE